MAWIMQVYAGDAHVVPDTEPDHVLERRCFCDPTVEPRGEGAVVTHRDEAQRILKCDATAG